MELLASAAASTTKVSRDPECRFLTAPCIFVDMNLMRPAPHRAGKREGPFEACVQGLHNPNNRPNKFAKPETKLTFGHINSDLPPMLHDNWNRRYKEKSKPAPCAGRGPNALFDDAISQLSLAISKHRGRAPRWVPQSAL